MKEATPRFKPSQRMKKRYLLFECGEKRPFDQLKGEFFGLGVRPVHLIEFDSDSGRGIVRCKRGLEGRLRKAMEEAGIKPIKTSGTLKKLRQIP